MMESSELSDISCCVDNLRHSDIQWHSVAILGAKDTEPFCLTNLAVEVQYAEFVHWLTGDEDVAEASATVQLETTGSSEDQ